MKTIAVDIDEVLARHNHALAQFHNQRYGTNHTAETYSTDHWGEVWEVSREEAERRAVEFHNTGSHGSLEVVSGAQDALAILKRDYNLVAVTVRRRQIIESTKLWLEQHFPGVFSDIRFVHMWEDENTQSKADICHEIGAEWLIDDSVKHVALMAESGAKGLLFGDYTWNQSESLPVGVKRVKNWPEVVEYFHDVRG